ncbi:MAG: TfoX/Sxy family protein [Gemmatimonadota bacterium]
MTGPPVIGPRPESRWAGLMLAHRDFPPYFGLMAYDEGLAQRVRETLVDHEGVTEKKMFGGLCFLLRGNMACGIVGDRLMVRTGPDAWAEALAQPHIREMDFTGRSLRGFVYVDSPALEDDGALEHWVRQGVDFAASLPSE